MFFVIGFFNIAYIFTGAYHPEYCKTIPAKISGVLQNDSVAIWLNVTKSNLVLHRRFLFISRRHGCETAEQGPSQKDAQTATGGAEGSDHEQDWIKVGVRVPKHQFSYPVFWP